MWPNSKNSFRVNFLHLGQAFLVNHYLLRGGGGIASLRLSLSVSLSLSLSRSLSLSLSVPLSLSLSLSLSPSPSLSVSVSLCLCFSLSLSLSLWLLLCREVALNLVNKSLGKFFLATKTLKVFVGCCLLKQTFFAIPSPCKSSRKLTDFQVLRVFVFLLHLVVILLSISWCLQLQKVFVHMHTFFEKPI